MNPELRQYVKEFSGEREEREDKKQRRAWQNAQTARTYQANSPEPGLSIDMYATDPHRGPLPYGPVTEERQTALSNERRGFVREVERARASNNGEIPLPWLLQFDLNELRAFNAGDIVDLSGLYDAASIEANHTLFRDGLEKQVQQRYESEMRGQTFWQKQQLGWAAIGEALLPGEQNFAENVWESQQGQTVDIDKIKDEVWAEATGTRDEIYEDDLSEWRAREEVRLHDKYAAELADPDKRKDTFDLIQSSLDMRENYARQQIVEGRDVAEVLGTQGLVSKVGSASAMAFGDAIKGAASLVGGVFWLEDALMPGSNIGEGAWWGYFISPYDTFVTRSIRGQQETMAEFNKEISAPMEERLNKAAHVGLEVAWEEFKTQDPDEYEDLVKMTGGEAQAMGFFGTMAKEQPEAKEQLANLRDSITARDELVAEDLREQNFNASHQVLDLLSMWGRNVPGRLSTGFTLLLTDQDYWDPLVQGKFGEVWNELGDDIEKNNFQPSSVVGLDGSLLGLGMDLGLGIAFDPTTWFFGPKFGGSSVAKSADDVVRLMESTPMKLIGDDIINISQAQTRGASTVYHATSWMGPRYQGKILDLLGITDKTMPVGKWINHSTGEGAQLVSVETLLKLLPEEDLARVAADVGVDAAKPTVEAVASAFDDLGNSILKEGFQEAGTLTISRADGTLHVTDGIKRIMASSTKDIRHVPMRLRVVDDAAVGHTVIPGFTGDEVAIIERVASSADDVLAEAAARGIKIKPGGDTAARTKIMADADDLIKQNGTGQQIGQWTARNGDQLPIHRIIVNEGTADEFVAYVTMKANKPVAVTYGSVGKEAKAEIIIAARSGGAGSMETMWDLARQHGDEFVLQAVGAEGVTSVSQSGVRFVSNYAKKLMDQATGQLKTVGVKLDDVWDGGLKKELASIEDLTGEVIMRPDTLISGEFLLGKVDKQGVMDIMREAVLDGARPTDGARSALNYSFAGRMKRALKTGSGKEARSFITKANTTTNFGLHGSQNIGKLYKEVIRMWGDDVAKADEWMQKIQEFHRRAEQTVGNNEAHLRALAPLQDEVKYLLHANGGAWDDAWRAADDAAKAEVKALKKEAKVAKRAAEKAEPTGEVFEVSTRGDSLGKKFSALNAKIKGRGGRTIEEIYQTDIKGYKTVREGKGKPPKQSISREALEEQYTNLWREWAEENPELMAKLERKIDEGYTLNDRFARPGTNDQARSLTKIIEEGRTGASSSADDALRTAKAQRKQISSNQKQIQEELSAKLKELEKQTNKVQKKADVMPDQTELAKTIEAMWNDFNANKIVPVWKHQIAKDPNILKNVGTADNPINIVDWKYLQRGSLKRGVESQPFVPKAKTEAFFAETLGVDIEKAGMTPREAEVLMRKLNPILETPMSINVPLSPLDMIAASTVSGKAWTVWTQTATGNAVREAVQGLNQVWVIDKVIRPATAATVSGDELLRMFHEGGRWAVGRYVNDRALFTSARIQHALHGGNPFGREAVRKGARYSARTQERLRRLDEMSMRSRQFERVYYDDYGVGYSDIRFGDPDYLDAAKRWTGGMLQQSGFRAFLRGKESFRDWFYSADGEVLRSGTVVSKDGASGKVITGPVIDVDAAYQGWETLFNKVVLARTTADDLPRIRQAWADTAKAIDDVGGKARDLPDWVFDYTGDVRGVVKHSKDRLAPLRLSDAFFDRFFLDPVNYRRGFVADMVAQNEKARLMGLYNSQGLRVVSDLELAHELGLRGVEGASRTGVRHFLADAARRRGLIPESHIDDMVQRIVDEEIEHMLYVADEGRRLGNVAAGTFFPFGKPFADMAGFWGREMIRRPHWRGVINEQNAGIIGRMATANGRFNPRTPALISRLAATDMEIDQGWIGNVEEGETKGLLPGSESTNLSPLFFLPTGGENPFYSMIPGFGYIPMWALDLAVMNIYDPIKNPLEYQGLVESIGDIVAGAHFGNPDPLYALSQRIIGGGTIGQLTEAALDIYTLFGGNGGYGPVSTVLGQPDREIDRGRYMSVVLSDPDTLNELLALEDDESIDLMLAALANEADSKAAKSNMFENVSRFILPTNNKYSGELDEIHDVWLDAAGLFPELSGSQDFDRRTATPEERTQMAGDVRSAFFDLPQADRDRLVTIQPSLAVNLISSWTWTDRAYREGAVDTSSGYRTDGSREGLARHDIYIKSGFIRPLAPQERAKRIVGLVLSAKEATAKRLYEQTASSVNDFLWDSVVTQDPTTMATLEGVISALGDAADALGIETPRELWSAWGSYEDDFETVLANAIGVDPVRGDGTKAGETQFDVIRKALRIDEKLKPWGTTYPGTDTESISKRMAELPITSFLITDDMLKTADAIGVDLTPGMTGEQLYHAVHAVVAETWNPVRLNVEPAYQTYVGERSAAARAALQGMRSIATNLDYSPEWRKTVDNFSQFEMNISNRYRDSALGTPPSAQLEVQERFMAIMNTADDTVVADWGELWKKAYERSYGPLGWTPPEPLSPFDDDGNVRNGAYQPYIQSITDGDSLFVTDRMGSKVGHEVRLLGVRARDFGLDDEGAEADKDRLWDRLQQAVSDGDRIYLVRQPDLFGNVDIYGRELAWLWIGDEPFYFSEEMLPNRDPSGGNR